MTKRRTVTISSLSFPFPKTELLRLLKSLSIGGHSGVMGTQPARVAVLPGTTLPKVARAQRSEIKNWGEGSAVRFPIRAHAWVAAWSPVGAHFSHRYFSDPLSPSLPLYLRKLGALSTEMLIEDYRMAGTGGKGSQRKLKA